MEELALQLALLQVFKKTYGERKFLVELRRDGVRETEERNI